MFSKSRGTSAVFFLLYALVVLLTVFFTAVSCALLLSQAVRTDRRRTWKKNFDAVVIGAAYVIVVRVVLHLLGCLSANVGTGGSIRRVLPEAEDSGP